MKLSAQEEYGLRCLIVLAQRKCAMTISEIAQEECLSQPYVAKLLNLLRKAGLIKSVRGQLGGYLLTKEPSEVSLGSVLSILGGRFYEPTFCERYPGLNGSCNRSKECTIVPLWLEIQNAIDLVLNKYALADLIHPKKMDELTRIYKL